MDVGLRIVSVRPDPRVTQRLKTGKYRVNQELNDEWIDIHNQGEYVLNLQGRILACVRREGLKHAPKGFEIIKQVTINSQETIPMQPGQKFRLFTGERPEKATQLDKRSRITRVLWLVQNSYLWLPRGNEAHLYFSQSDLRQGNPLARCLLG